MNKYMYLSGKVNMKARRPAWPTHSFNARCSYRLPFQALGCVADGARSSVSRPLVTFPLTCLQKEIVQIRSSLDI